MHAHVLSHVYYDQIVIDAGYVISMIIIYAQWQRIHLSLIIKDLLSEDVCMIMGLYCQGIQQKSMYSSESQD